MHITELDSYRLGDAVKFHNRLNPKLWGKDEHLLPDVQAKLMEIAADFQEFLGISDLDVEDITISGSNAAFSYTPHSDIDLHLVVRKPAEADEVYQELFNAKKYQYNDMHDIRIHGADVELYVQDAAETPVSLGEYSVKNGKWIQVPKRKRAQIDQSVVRHKYEDLVARIQEALKTDDAAHIAALLTKIKTMRQTGLDQHGEFGPENLAFKILRKQGYIQKLYAAQAAARDRELSLQERNRPKQRVRYGFAEDNTGMAQGSSIGDAGAQSTWDGVSPDTDEFLSEDSNENIVQDFIQDTAHRLGIERMPKIELHQDSDWSRSEQSFGMYEPESHTLHVNMANRHLMDILRTTAHELTHCRQNEISPLPDHAGDTGSKWENQANATAGVIMRDYAEAHPELFEKDAVAESSGYIPTAKQKNDPRFKTALTVDIKPGATGREANKMALQTGPQGEPTLLIKGLRNALREFKETGRIKEMDKFGNQDVTGPETPPTMPAGTVKVDVSDVYDWYKLGQHISNMKGLGKHDFGKGAPSAIISFGDEDTEHEYIKDLEKTGLTTTDIDPSDPNQPAGMPRQKTDPTYNVAEDDLSEIDRRGALRALGAGALAAAVPAVAQAGPFVDVAALGKTDPDQFEKIWMPRYQELNARCQEIMRRLIAAAGPKWASALKGTTIRVVSSENYAQASALSRTITIDLSVFWDAPDAALAFTIAHELGHIALDHGVGTDDASADYKTQVRVAAQYRQGELDADEFAVRLCKALGYNKAEVFKFIAKNEEELRLLDLLTQSPTSSHPSQKTRIERAKMNGFQLSKGGIQQMNALKQHLAERNTAYNEQEFTLLEDEYLNEIQMSPTNLRKLAAQTGAMAGMEFEMIVPDVGMDDVEPEYEPDYDQDQRSRSFSDIRDFFHDGDYNGRRDVDNLMEEIQNEYEEWKMDQTADAWTRDGLEYITDYISLNDLFDRDEAMLVARDEIMDANPDLPQESEEFTQLLSARLDEMEREFAAQELEDQGRIYNDAFEAFAEEQADEYDERSFLDDKYPYMQDVQNNFDISWPYYYDINDGQDGDMDIDQVADDFSNYMGKPVNASRQYHGGRREAGTYVVEPDGSLEGDNPGDEGLEFVSPPMPIDEMISDLNKVKAWAKREKCYTNDSTGLHINISVPEYSLEKLDYVKLALLMGDEYVLDLFGRSGNTYAKSAISKIKTMLQRDPSVAPRVMDKMREHMEDLATKAIHTGTTDKYTSINTKSGYIEFRSPGGDWLDENFDKIENTLLRFTVALSAAIDPEAYRQEYLKKLYKLLAGSQEKGGPDILQLFANYSAGELDKAALIRQVREKQLARDFSKGKIPKGQKYWWKVARPGYFASVELVASSKEEAIEKGKKEYPDWRNAQDMTAEPLRPYQEPQTPGAAGPSLNDRPSNPDGNWVIIDTQAPRTPVYRFMAANDRDALLVLRQWIAANPGSQWTFALDADQLLGQPGPRSAAQPSTGNWGIWMNDMDRFARAPGQSDNSVLRRFPSREAAEQFITQGREQNSRMRTDIEVREIEPSQPIPGSTLDLQRQRAAQAGSFQEPNPSRGNLTPTGPGPWEIYRISDNSSVRELSNTSRPAAAEEARNALGLRGEAPELYGVRTRANADAAQGGTVDVATDRIAPRTLTTPGQGQQTFTGEWKIVTPDGSEIHRFGGIGNAQADANRVAIQWLQRNPRHMQDGVEVVPVMG